MTHARRTDTAQPAIVAAFLAAGASVWDAHALGGGCDIVVGMFGRNWIFEIKTPGRAKEHKEHLRRQLAWRQGWRGQADQIESFEDGMKIIRSRIEAME